MNEMSIFDFFGGAPESKDALVKPLPKKEVSKGKVTEKEKKRNNPAKGIKFERPVTVIGRSFVELIPGEGEICLQEVAQWLHEKGYEEVRHERIKYAKLDEHTTQLLYDALRESAEDELVEGEAVICEGGLKARLSTDEEGEDRTVKDLKELGLPGEEYRDACLDYDQTSGVAIPVGRRLQLRDGSLSEDAQVRYMGITHAVKAGEDLTARVVGELMEGADGVELSEIGGAKFLMLLPKLSSRCPNPDRSAFGINEKKVAKKVAEKIKLPVTVRFVNFARDYPLNAEDFAGKMSVTWDELLECLKKKEPLFAQKDRKVDHLYDEGAGCVSVAVISGSKGALFEHPCFTAGFSMKEKIPRRILVEIVTRFGENLEKEAIAFIWRKDGKYEVAWPLKEDANAVGVLYEMPILKGGDYVMAIHSHNVMQPFFSSVDDADELSMPGLYGVIGRIREEEDGTYYESVFRAVTAPGEYISVTEGDSFEGEAEDEE